VAAKVIGLARKRGFVLLAVSAISALLSAKVGGLGGGGIQSFGFWDGPA
jgi:hypothetical protein